jgi:HK97 family phage prohead protease
LDERKSFNISTKSATLSNRVIRFIGSDESIDRDGDTISIDGWDVGAYMKNPVVLFGHDSYALPIAKTISVTADKRMRQLLFDIQFPTIEELSTNPGTPSDHALKVDAIYNMAKAGILNTVSVGFRGIEYDATATGRAYKKQELMEISIVPIPANPNAVAVLRAAGASDIVIKGVTTMETKGNKKLSKESRAYLAERIGALDKACQELKTFIADDPEDAEEGDPEDKGAGKPVVNQEIGADVNKPQDEKNYVIDIVEKASTDETK